MLHPMLEHAAGKFHETFPRNGLFEFTDIAHGTLALAYEPLEVLEPEGLRDKHVVPDFGVPVQRQVVSVERNPVLHQAAHAFAEFPDKHAVFALPEPIRVVHDDAVGLVFDGGIDQAVTERHSRHNAGHLVGGLDA